MKRNPSWNHVMGEIHFIWSTANQTNCSWLEVCTWRQTQSLLSVLLTQTHPLSCLLSLKLKELSSVWVQLSLKYSPSSASWSNSSQWQAFLWQTLWLHATSTHHSPHYCTSPIGMPLVPASLCWLMLARVWYKKIDRVKCQLTVSPKDDTPQEEQQQD